MMNTLRILVLFGVILVQHAPTAAEPIEQRDYRSDMRQWVQAISAYAKTKAPGFIVVPHKGEELLTINGKSDSKPDTAYIKAIAGQSFEGVFYGNTKLDIPTSSVERGRLFQYIEVAKANELRPLVLDFCFTRRHVENSVAWNQARNYLSFAGDHIELNTIPSIPNDPPQAHTGDVLNLAAAQNLLCLATSRSFSEKLSYIHSIATTDFDVVILDPCYQKEPLTPDDLAPLRTKAGGGKRLLLAYLKVGVADSQLAYWQEVWQPGTPPWLVEKSLDSTHDFYIQYWNSAWQQIIMGSEDSPIDQILNSGFDGVYLVGIDAYKHFEKPTAKSVDTSEEKTGTETITPEG